MDNKLKDRIKDLKDQLADLLVDKEEMLTVGYQQLNANYSQKIGKYELHLYEREYEYIKLRRKVDLIKVKQGKGETDIDLYSLDQRVDKDYQDFKLRIDSRRKIAEQSEDYFTESKLNLRQYEKMRELYWQVVRQIHPDINLDGDDNDKRTWMKANQAFEEGDIYKVETYAISSAHPEEPDEDPSQADLEEEIKHLEKKIGETTDYISSLAKVHPYNKKGLLSNIQELEEKKAEIEARTAKVDEKISKMEADLLDLLII